MAVVPGTAVNDSRWKGIFVEGQRWGSAGRVVVASTHKMSLVRNQEQGWLQTRQGWQPKLRPSMLSREPETSAKLYPPKGVPGVWSKPRGSAQVKAGIDKMMIYNDIDLFGHRHHPMIPASVSV